jgi:hypothetical protein
MFDFSTETKSFDKQYAAIYFSRLQRLKRVVLKVAEAALPLKELDVMLTQLATDHS